jgi:hypothetical protein
MRTPAWVGFFLVVHLPCGSSINAHDLEHPKGQRVRVVA